MNIGDVLYFYDHAFADGGHADKLFVVLSDPQKDKVVLIMATSQNKSSSTNPGCQPAAKRFHIKKGQYSFPKDTWLDLGRSIQAVDTQNVVSRMQSKEILLKGTLPIQVVNEIKNCLKKNALDSLTREACDLLGMKPYW